MVCACVLYGPHANLYAVGPRVYPVILLCNQHGWQQGTANIQCFLNAAIDTLCPMHGEHVLSASACTLAANVL